MSSRVAIVGGGIVGLATAYRFLQVRDGSSVVVLEKEAGPGRHQSTHNSGVLHAGLYYKPGSLKARLAVSGIRQMVAFCQKHNIAHEICGKLVVATHPDEMPRLHRLYDHAIANGLSDVRLLDLNQMREMEPHVGGLAALHVPEEGIVDYAQVCAQLVKEIEALGGAIKFQSRVQKIIPDGKAWKLQTASSEIDADFLVNCAGLHSDRVATLTGGKPAVKIIPFRGEYYQLSPASQHLVRNLIYPIPDPLFPFLGVHFTRLIRGGIEAGPNAVLAWAREGYRKQDINLADLCDAIGYPGLWRFLRQHRRMCWAEIQRSWSKRLFCKSLQRLVPDLRREDLTPGGAGVRAQAMHPSGELVQDFSLLRESNALHLVNAPSPAATASLAIGSEIVSLMHQGQ